LENNTFTGRNWFGARISSADFLNKKLQHTWFRLLFCTVFQCESG